MGDLNSYRLLATSLNINVLPDSDSILVNNVSVKQTISELENELKLLREENQQLKQQLDNLVKAAMESWDG